MFTKMKGLTVGALLSIFAGSALADVPAAASTAITAIQTDGLAIADLAWPVLGAILGVSILMKLFKKFMNKAT
jgi:hypothetical protein